MVRQKTKRRNPSRVDLTGVQKVDSSFVPYVPRASATTNRETSAGPKKVAICIGIDDYPNEQDRLRGCVNDANRWSDWFQRQGFSVRVLANEMATRAGIRDVIQQVIVGANAETVVAIQYSGHGTQLPDFDSDEPDGQDEALVPFDHRENGYLTDDSLSLICDQIPDGVSVSFFMDCCHSGSNTRQLLIGKPSAPMQDVKTRFLRADEEMIASYRKQCQAARRRAIRSAAIKHREVLFSACRPEQTAKERDGQGDFSRIALQVLSSRIGTLTNAQFLESVLRAGSNAFSAQDPQLWADDSLHHAPFLGTVTGRNSSGHDDELQPSALHQLAEQLQQVVDRLKSL